jgi:acetyltransferase-like isoleucine patch superfamily enzyme
MKIQMIKKIVNKFFTFLKRLLIRYKPILGKNNILVKNGVLHNIKYDILGDNIIIEICHGAVLSDLQIYIRGNGHKITIGEYCIIKGGSIWIEDEFCEVKIGSKTTIGSAHIAVTEPNRRVIIGEDCMFSNSIEFRTGDSHSIIDTKKRINMAKDIVIGNHVWIGAHSIILKGVKIGDNSMIGINSIVTQDIPNNSVAAGIPSKVIRSNTTWIRERI